MFFTALTTFLRLVLVAVIMAIELSVAIPVVSITILFLYMQQMNMVTKSIALALVSLVLSGFAGLQWSVLFLLLAGGWIVIELTKNQISNTKNRIIVVSISTTLLYSWLAGVSFSTRTIMYTVIFSLLAFVIARHFLQERNRHRLIEWISPAN